MKILHRAKGIVHDLIVTRKNGTITLWSSEGNRHTVFDSAAPHLPGLEYARNMLAALAFCPQAQSCLVLGLGGGSIPRMLLAARPGIRVEAVEIDPAVVELAARYFDIHALPCFTVHLGDAAEFLRHCTSRYGIVVVDTYVGERFSEQCVSGQFIKDARECLLDNGVFAVNWSGDDSQMRNDLLKNIGEMIGPVWSLPGLKSHNVLYFAPAGTARRAEIISAAAAIATEIPFENSLERLAHHLRPPG